MEIRRAVSAIALGASLFVAGATSAGADVYVEVGLEGASFSSAQQVTGGPYSGISDNIAGGASDFFLFGWQGGTMQFSFTCGGCSQRVTGSIYDSNDNQLLSPAVDETVTLSLGPGNYYLVFTAAAAADPPISSSIFTLNPDGSLSTNLDVFAPTVPEPSTWAMMILGFVGLGFMAYRRKSKPSLMEA